ncbi:MAG: hypothetical protein ABFE08_20585 [Armatimonadia bacterium]
MRAAYVVGGLILMLGSFVVWGGLYFEGMFSGRNVGLIQMYDLRPLAFGGRDAQLWTVRIVQDGWVLLGLSGLIVLIAGIIGRPHGRRGGLFLIVPALAAVLLLVPGSTVYRHAPGSTRIASLEGLQRRLQLEFPPGTRLLEARAELGLDPVTAARIVIPRDALVRFVKTEFAALVPNEVGQPRLQISRDVWSGMDFAEHMGLSNWHPESAQAFIAAWAKYTRGPAYLELFADLTPQDLVTVYIVRHH